MDTNKNELVLLNEQYGISILPIEREEFEGFIKVNDCDFAKLNACFREVPQMLKSMNDARFYSGSYKVIYEKGFQISKKRECRYD